MSAHGADLGSIVAHVDVAAVAADPHGLLTGGEDHVVLQVGQQLQVALLVLLLDDGDPFEQSGDAVEALLTGGLGHLLVHGHPLVVLTLGGSLQVFTGVTNAAQLLEPDLGVLLLVVGSLGKQSGDLLITLLLCLAGEVGVFVACLALTGKCCPQIGLGLASLEFHIVTSFK